MTTNLDLSVTAEELARLRASLDAVVATPGEEAYDLVHQDPPGPMPVCDCGCLIDALPNFLRRSSDPTDVVAAWPDDSGAALLAAKKRWDPANLFRLGHALLPAPADAP